jgi:hypothetical protein
VTLSYRVSLPAALLLAGLALAACGGSDNPPPTNAPPPPPPKPSAAAQPSGGGFFDNMFSATKPVSCPQVSKVGEAALLTRFRPPGHDITDVVFDAFIGDINGKCEGSDQGVTVKMTVDFVASRGPAEKDHKATFAYFVAITDAKSNVIAREQFDTFIDFPGNKTRNGIREELEEKIPLTAGQRGDDFRVYVGFALTHDELAYNRAHPQ